MTLLAGFVYLAAMVAIGIWSARRTRTSSDYFLAGRGLGLVTSVFATMASIMSGFVFVGGPGLFYSVGLASFWIVISSSFTGAMLCWVLARPLFEVAGEHEALTIPDAVLKRFGDRASSGLTAFAILIGTVGYLATQLQALGTLLGTFFELSQWQGTLLGIAVLLSYTVAGGMIASVYTDVVQGVIMLWVTTLVAWFAVRAGGGPGNLFTSLQASDSEALSPWGTVGVIGALSWFFVFSVGSLGQPHVVHKLMMVKRIGVLRFFPLVLALSMIACGLVWLFGGLVVRLMVANGTVEPLANPDEAIIVFLAEAAPRWFSALAYLGIVSAIMSTVDSFVNIGSAALVRDLPSAFGVRFSKQVPLARVAVVLLFGVAGGFALRMNVLVAYLGIFAFGIFASALVPVLAIGLNWPRAGYWAARSSLVVGIVSCLGLELLNRSGLVVLRATPSAISLALACAVFVAAGTLSGRQNTVGAGVEAVRELPS